MKPSCLFFLFANLAQSFVVLPLLDTHSATYRSQQQANDCTFLRDMTAEKDEFEVDEDDFQFLFEDPVEPEAPLDQMEKAWKETSVAYWIERRNLNTWELTATAAGLTYCRESQGQHSPIWYSRGGF
jgi:hypothetical protein